MGAGQQTKDPRPLQERGSGFYEKTNGGGSGRMIHTKKLYLLKKRTGGDANLQDIEVIRAVYWCPPSIKSLTSGLYLTSNSFHNESNWVHNGSVQFVFLLLI